MRQVLLLMTCTLPALAGCMYDYDEFAFEDGQGVGATGAGQSASGGNASGSGGNEATGGGSNGGGDASGGSTASGGDTASGGSPGGCSDPQEWFADCDGDGFAGVGALSETACEAPSSPPNCQAGPDPKWTDEKPSGSKIDCFDEDARVFPGAPEWHTSPVADRPTRVAFDYNCDTIEERRYTQVVSFGDRCTGSGTSCSGDEGWLREPGPGSEVPNCGDRGTWTKCVVRGGGSCERDLQPDSKRQECR